MVKDLFKKAPLGFLPAFLCCWFAVIALLSAPLPAAPGTPANEEGTRLWLSDQGNGLKTASADHPVTTTGDTLKAEAHPPLMVAQGWISQPPICKQFPSLATQKNNEINALHQLVSLLRNEENNVEVHSKAAEDHKKKAEQAFGNLYTKAGVVKTMIYTSCVPFKEDGQEAVPQLAGVRAAAINLPPSQGVRDRITAAYHEAEHEFEEILNKHIPNAEREKIATEQAKAKVLRLRDELRMRKQPIRDFIIDWYQRAPNCIEPSTEAINRNLDTLKNRLPDVVEKDVEALEQKANRALDDTRAFRDRARFFCYEYAAKLPALCDLPIVLTKRPDKANIHPGEKAIYTYTLTNPGTRAFIDVRLVDNVCRYVNYVSGDTTNPRYLDPGETWTFRCEQILTKTTTNMAQVEAIFEMKVLASHLVSATVNRTATATVTVAPDTTPPTVTAFALPTMWGSLQVPIRTFTATDDVAVTGYMVSEDPTAPTPGHTSWKPAPHTSFTFSSQGTKTLYAWAKDGAGNVSASVSASVVIQPLIEVPNVIGQMGHTARQMIKDHNLVVGVIQQMMSNSPTSTVISQDPLGHSPSRPSLVPPGTRVNIWISQAFPTGPGRVPNVVGMTVQEATQTLTNAGYIPTNAGTEPSDLAVGLVCRQNPEWGQAAAPGSTVSFWVTSNVPKYLYLDPPRATLKVGQQVSFTVTLVMKDGANQVLTPNQVQWDPGPLNQFACVKPGKFIVWARFGNAHGSATVTCEEDWSVPAWEPPISKAGNRDARVPSARPGDYTWYAFCNPKTGEVTYGQQLPTGQKIMAGPFPGPRTVYDWIATKCSTWRCNTDGTCALTPAMGGPWKVLCGKNDLRVVLGTTFDFTKHMLIKDGFLGEPDARSWANKVYPDWVCLADGKSPGSTRTGLPNRGGRWAVVCDRRHGGVSLTEHPDVTRHWIMSEGFLGEPDARTWTDQNCPSWRCNAEGKCLAGVAPPRPGDRPLELPPEPERGSGTDWWDEFTKGFRRGAGETAQETRQPPEEARKVYTKPSPPVSSTSDKERPSDQKPKKQEWLSDAEAKALQKELWDRYNKKWCDEWCIHREERKKKAGKGGRINWSGCAEEPLRALKVPCDRAWWARTREKQGIVRNLAACYDPCVMRDISPQDRQRCYKDCNDRYPMPK